MIVQRRLQRGLTSVEYVTAGGLVAFAVILAFATFGDSLKLALQFIVGNF